jgi:hypothetical protein
MVVWFTTTYAMTAYHHWCCEFDSRSGQGVQHYVMKFVGDLRQVCGFLCVHRFSPTNKTDRHDIIQLFNGSAGNRSKYFPRGIGNDQSVLRSTTEGNITLWSFPIPRGKLFDLLSALPKITVLLPNYNCFRQIKNNYCFQYLNNVLQF